MASGVESLIFDILAKDNASSAFIRAGKSAKDAAGDVQSLTDRLVEVSKQSVSARVGLEGDTDANRKIDTMQAKLIKLGETVSNPNIDVGGAVRAQQQIDRVSAELDKLSSKGDTASKAMGLLGGIGGAGGGVGVTGMGAVVAGAAVLSPVLVTLGFGLGGLAGAAYGVAKGIETAAQKTGGLKANLHTLNPEQQTVARSLLSLQKSYGDFEHAVQPEVIGAFNKALTFAKNIMHDVEPVAVATGKGFESFIGQIDTAFTSGTWTGFWNFMARTAEPDMKLLGQDVAALIQDLPELLQALQPVAQGALTTLRSVEQLPQAISKVANATSASPSGNGGLLDFLAKAGSAGSGALNNFVNYLSTAQGKTDGLAQSLGTLGHDLSGTGRTVAQVNPAISRFGDYSAAAQKQVAAVSGASRDLSNNAVSAVKPVAGVAGATRDLSNNAAAAQKPLAGIAGSSRDLSNNAVAAARDTNRMGKEVDTLSDYSHKAASNLEQVYEQVTNLHNAETKSLNTLTSYNDALINQYNSAATLNQNLKASKDQIGLNTAAQRASFSAADQYIANTITAAKQAGNNSGEINNVITSLRNELPKLQSVQGGTKQYWQEVRTLVGWLHTLERERAIHETITVTGKGQYAVSQGIQRQIPGIRAAAGGMVSGGVAGHDSVAALLTPGEVVVPAGMVRAGAVNHLKGMLPGFAGGGVVGSYSGPVPGIPGFFGRETQQTVNTIAGAVASAIRSAITAPGGGSSSLHPTGSGASIMALMQSMAASVGWTGAQWNALFNVEMREAGFSLGATNKSSGAYGLAQFINGPSEYYQYGGNPNTAAGQITGMLNYIHQRYGAPSNAWAHEQNFGWYGSGFHGVVSRPTLFGAGERGTEHVDITPAGAKRGNGSLVTLTQNGNVYLREPQDAVTTAKKISFAIVSSGGFG